MEDGHTLKISAKYFSTTSLEDLNIEDNFPHCPEIEHLVKGIISIGLLPIKSSIAPPSVTCHALWRYSEMNDLLSGFNRSYFPISWCIDDDGLTLKPTDHSISEYGSNPEVGNEKLITSSRDLAEYLFETVRLKQQRQSS